MPDSQPPQLDDRARAALVDYQRLLDWTRQLTASLGPDDYLVLQAPPGLDQTAAVQLGRHLSLQAAARGITFQLVDADRRVQVVRLPPTMTPVPQTTDLRDGPRA